MEPKGQSLAVELRGLTKVFGRGPTALRANDGIDLKIRKGSIHGIIGENGAGKSTAMKMLYGIYKPDAGEMVIDGQTRIWNSPADAIAAGIGMVHQHFMLGLPYSVLDNIVLGAEAARAFGIINRTTARKKLEAICKQYEMPVNLDAAVGSLPVGVQQRVEILKLLYRNARILILDEPTAVLTPQEITELFSNLRRLRDEGKTVLIITHKLKEVMAITDRVTCFRAGKVTGEVDTCDTSPDALAQMMVGRKVALAGAVPQAESPHGEVAGVAKASGASVGIALKNVRDRSGELKGVTLTVSAGEIVGIAGVEGNGQSELLRVLNQPARFLVSGDFKLLGQDASRMSATEVKALGMGYIPEDRIEQGLLLESTLTDNFMLGHSRHPDFTTTRAGVDFVNSAGLKQQTEKAIEEFDVRPRNSAALAGGLSGGNQQKLIFARENYGIHASRERGAVLVVAQPTRGVDVGAIEMLHERLRTLRDQGVSILLVSSELDEILALSDRVLVMYGGAIVAEYPRGVATETELGLKMGGAP